MSCGRQQRTESDLRKKVRADEIVWVYGEGGVVQKGKGAVRWCMVRRTGKCSKGGG